MLAVLDEIATLPPTDQGHQENKLVDMLVANRNIPSLLVRAFLSTNQTEKNLALNWVKRFMTNSPRRVRRRHEGTRNLDDALKDMAVLNAWLGYFWTAPILEWRTGKRISDAEMIKAQKELLVSITETL